MKLHELTDRGLATAKRKLADAAAKAQRRADIDLGPVVEGFRGGETVLVLMPFEDAPGAAGMLRAAFAAAVGFGCDAIICTTDTYIAIGEEGKDGPEGVLNPLTGRPWERGDMQELAEHHQGLEWGWITEALFSFGVNRAGDVRTAGQGYRLIEHKGNLHRPPRVEVEWTEAGTHPAGELEAAGDGPKVSGHVARKLVEFMNHPSAGQMMHQAGLGAEKFGLSVEQALARMDCATIKWLPDMGFRGGALLSSDNAERSAVIEESLGQLPGALGWA